MVGDGCDEVLHGLGGGQPLQLTRLHLHKQSQNF